MWSTACKCGTWPLVPLFRVPSTIPPLLTGAKALPEWPCRACNKETCQGQGQAAGDCGGLHRLGGANGLWQWHTSTRLTSLSRFSCMRALPCRAQLSDPWGQHGHPSGVLGEAAPTVPASYGCT
jgi:hypothetical protein